MTAKAPSVQRSTFTNQALPGCVPQFDQDSLQELLLHCRPLGRPSSSDSSSSRPTYALLTIDTMFDTPNKLLTYQAGRGVAVMGGILG
jgi:hypothetical protein